MFKPKLSNVALYKKICWTSYEFFLQMSFSECNLLIKWNFLYKELFILPAKTTKKDYLIKLYELFDFRGFNQNALNYFDSNLNAVLLTLFSTFIFENLKFYFYLSSVRYKIYFNFFFIFYNNSFFLKAVNPLWNKSIGGSTIGKCYKL